MAKSAKKKFEESVLNLSRDIMGLVAVYGPIEVDDLVDKIEDYFPKDYESVNIDDVFGIIDALGKADMVRINEDDIVSFFSDREMNQLVELDELKTIYYSAKEKEFDDPQEILNYADIFDIQNNKAFTRLKNYMDKLDYKPDVNKQQQFQECIIFIFKLYDINEYVRQLKEKLNGKLDEKRFLEYVDVLGAIIPRGFLHGYSFGELGELLEEEIDYFKEFEMYRLDKPKRVRQFPTYTYEKCLELAEELKNTAIFENFCSDNIIELIINKKEIYVQLLGYYNGDRNIIIYRDWDEMVYDYQFIMAGSEQYPDLSFRIHHLEAVLDSIGGFLTPDLEKQIRGRKLPQLPVFIDIDSLKGPILAKKKDINLIGAVLESLLSVYSDMAEDIGENCEEGNTNRIVQFHLLKNDDLKIGYFDCIWLGEAFAPFEVNPIEGTVTIHAKHATDINIGIFTMPVTDEDKLAYITIIRDVRSEMVIGFDLSKEEDMTNILHRIIGKLEDIDVRPSTLTFNNAFAENVLDELYDVYDLIPEDGYENEELNELYEMFAFGDLPTDGLIH